MKVRLIAVAATLLLSVFALAGCGPFLLIPGGELAGVNAAPRATWSFIDEISTVQLETRPSDPYSINIWVVAMGPALYIHAGANPGGWVEHIAADSDVRVLVEGKIYELAATRVEAQAEFDQFSDAYDNKYDVRPRNENVEEAYLFRLEAR